MPYVSDSNLDENQQTPQDQQAGQVSGSPGQVSGSTSPAGSSSQNPATDAPAAPTLASGGGSTAAGSGGGKQGSAATYDPSAPTSSGQWVNLQSYLDANNGGQFGQQFAGNVGNDVNRARASVDTAATNFQQGVDSATVQTNPDVLTKVETSPEGMSPDEQAAFRNQLKASYAGPQSASADAGFQKANAQAQDAFGESQATQTAEGQKALLQKFYQRPTYTAGSQALDSAILTADPNAQAALHSLSKDASTLPVSYQAAAKAANDRASSALATTNASREAAESTLGADANGNLIVKKGPNGAPMLDAKGNPIYSGAIGTNKTSLEQNSAAALQAAKDAIANDEKMFAPVGMGASSLFSGDPAAVATRLQGLGFNKDLAERLAGVTGIAADKDLQYSTRLAAAPSAGAFYHAGAPTQGSVADPQQVSRLAALYSLAGLDPNTVTSQYPGAGTPNTSSFDTEGYKNALGQWVGGVGQDSYNQIHAWQPNGTAASTDNYNSLSLANFQAARLAEALGIDPKAWKM